MSAEVVGFLLAAVRLSLPIGVAAAGELVSQRAGVLNLSLDAFLLSSAFTAALVAQRTGSPVLGALAGLLAALVVAVLQAVLSVLVGANQLVTGIALNSLVLGATTFGARLALGGGGTGLPGFATPGKEVLAGVPLIGPLLVRPVLVWVGVATAALVLVLLARTQVGVVVRAVGESGRVTDATGLPVRRVRFLAVLVSGATAGIAGASVVLVDVGSFTDGMTSGLGYLAVIAVIAGSWRSRRVVLACLLLGAARALEFQAQTFGVAVPVAVFQLLPYVVALLAVAGLAGRHAGPADLSTPFVRSA